MSPSNEPPIAAPQGGDPRDEIARSYERAFEEAISEGGSIYGGTAPMPPLTQAAHERRLALLDGLPIGDLSDSVVADFGVGSWGFACVYPRLQHCREAIGLDISAVALAESQRVSDSGSFPYGRNVRYLVSRGDRLPLEDETVDVLFAGESIEHVDHTEAFFDEVYRVLKPGGRFVLTTPNADAYLHKQAGETAAIGPEHVGLLGYTELVDLLQPAFEIITAQGFNLSMHRLMDPLILDPEFARQWASLFLDAPYLASGLVLLLRRRDGYRPSRYLHESVHHTSPAIRFKGAWDHATLHRDITGRRGTGRASCEFTCRGEGLILQFWAHDWSGEAVIAVDGQERLRVSLFEPLGGFRRVHLKQLGDREHHVTIRLGDRIDPRSAGDQVILHRAIAYRRDV